MKRLTALGQLILGDFRERTRRYSFLWTMIGTTFFGYLVLIGKYKMIFNGFQPVVNSAWVGTMMAMFCAIMMALVGFYLINNTIKRDTREGVGQILAATPLSNLMYLFTRFVSNFLVLVACTSILSAMSVVMQIFSRYRGDFSLVDLLAPYAVITLPVLFFVAGVAVLFESSRRLRGSFGNVLYFIALEIVIVSSIGADRPLLDLVGSHLFRSSVEATILAAHPGAEIGVQIGFVDIFDSIIQPSAVVFYWPGVGWTFNTVWPRLGYVACGLVLVLTAALLFKRFDPAVTNFRARKNRVSNNAPESLLPPTTSSIGYHLLAKPTRRLAVFGMIIAELRVMLKGFHWTWYLVGAGLVVAQFTAPLEVAQRFLLPAALIWPLPFWSSMGTRNKRFNTEMLLSSIEHPLRRQLSACWFDGYVVTLLAVSGVMIRLLMVGQITEPAALLAGALFVPTVALALGTLTGTRKFFEVSYLLIWYVGLVDQLWLLDFIGATEPALSGGVPWVFLSASCALLGAAVLTERTRLQLL